VFLVSAEPVTAGEFEVFYKTQYPILIKFLRFLDASVEEAEDAAQKAMVDLYRRLREGTAVVSPVAWVRCAAHHHFVKERERDRGRLPREVKGGHLTPDGCADNSLTAWEDEQHVEQLLGELTPTERVILRLVLDGLSTREIADRLGKHEGNVRQQLKNGRDKLKLHPEIASRARLAPPRPVPGSGKPLVRVPEAPEGAGQ
jgi:RNA polymerase sigma factor (sigma-70 family)